MKPANQFRMTLWFKKGELVEAAADAADDDAPSDELLPIEDRYADDGSVTREDSRLFSLHTGQTQLVDIHDLGRAGDADELSPLVRELKRGRGKIVAALGATVAALGAVAVMYVM